MIKPIYIESVWKKRCFLGPPSPIWDLAVKCAPKWRKNGTFWLDKGPHYPPQLSDGCDFDSFGDFNSWDISMNFMPLKTPPSPLQLSNRDENATKNTPNCPYNCRMGWFRVVLGCCVSSCIKSPINTLLSPYNCQNAPKMTLKHPPIAPTIVKMGEFG